MQPLILVGLPGAGAGGTWLIHWNMLFARFMREYRVVCCYGMGANIYQVRNYCMPAWDKLPQMPEYMLWLDSDNLATYEGFTALRTALENNPALDMVAGWAWTQDVMGDESPKISAGCYNSPSINLQYAEISRASKANRLLMVDWTGLCFALIRASSLQRLGSKPFMPVPVQDGETVHLLSEDESFCLRASDMGFTFAVHPGVEVPHLKLKPIRPEIDATIHLETEDVIVQRDLDRTGDLKPEEVPT